MAANDRNAFKAGLFIVIAQRGHGDVVYGPGNRVALIVLGLGGLLLLAGAAGALALTDHVRQLSGMCSRCANRASTAAADFAPQPARPGYPSAASPTSAR